MPYTIEEHKHRYAAWAASRAASTKTCRFSVLQGKKIIEAVGLNELIQNPDLLPPPREVDNTHRQWREKAISTAKEILTNNDDSTGFSDGVAAKLINVYLKGAFVCAGYERHENVVSLHPPIDSLLLEELYTNDVGGFRNVWEEAKKIRWSKFNAAQYENTISAIRVAMGDKPLWMIESYWRGYQ